ncbi:excinuclease ABC subunit UvrC [Candidatus Margulisiibacteriota bacterium]
MSIPERVKELPLDPGVYIMKDQQGQILYIGKAKSLRKRVQSYFREQDSLKTKQLVLKIADIEVMITPSEIDALILENNLIKKHKPFYNLELKDDKRYPYLKLIVNEEYPRLLVVRRYQDDGARYFGPYAGQGSILQVLKLIRTAFPLRQCAKKLPKKVCLELQIKRCLGPCINKDLQEEYAQVCKDLILFLEGKQEELISGLEEKMQFCSKNKKFEKAALYRDRLKKLNKISGHQEMVLAERTDQDFIVFFKAGQEEGVDILKVRGGKVLGNEVVFFKRNEEENVLERMLTNYYERKTELPDKIVLEKKAAPNLLREWFAAIKKQKVEVVVDPEHELIKMAKRNIEYLKLRNIKEEEVFDEALAELQTILNLEYLPARIEGYDISNTGSGNIIGSQVVFIDGKPEKKEYRHYNIKTVKGKQDDYASLREMLARRSRKISEKNLPELWLIDGGKGHLAIAEAVLKQEKLAIPVVSIAKGQEDVYFQGSKVDLPKDSFAQKLLQRIRDEAHRFGIGFHRKQRGKASLRSLLDEIAGVGPQTKKKILFCFKGQESIQTATVESLAEVVNAKLAQKIYNYFHGG